MAKQTIVVELDSETIRCLTTLGNASDVLTSLALAAADGVRGPGHPKREQTNESLRVERQKSDGAFAQGRAAVEPDADGVFVAAARKRTDSDLSSERADAYTLIVDQREANEQMVGATIRAEELMLEADAARARAEKSERELRAVAEFREMFLAMLGHDLRNPLGSISMCASLLLRPGRLEEREAEMAARIIRSAQRMSRMITQLLDLARARLGGGFPIHPAPIDVGEVCQNVVEEFEAVIQLNVEGDVTGSWDPDRLAEALSNLVGNAIEHAAPGTVVSVHARGVGADVVVEVTNQGDPIPADVLPFIFEPFRRAQPGRASPTGNLGLGLYIAHQIVGSHGGALDAHSGGGTTTFAMRLPRFAA